MVNETLFKEDQIAEISSHLGIYKTTVGAVITEYVSYLKENISGGKTVKFLNVCYLKVSGKDLEVRETLGYISNEIGKRLALQQDVVYRILSSLEDFMIKDLRRLSSYSIRGLIRIRLEKNSSGNYVVRTKKSTTYNGYAVYITTLPRFKRKAEMVVG